MTYKPITPESATRSTKVNSKTTRDPGAINMGSGSMTPSDLLRLELLGDFEKYIKIMFKAQHGRDFVMAWHHKQIIKALEDVIDGKTTRLIINIAPRYSKTEIVIKQFISYGFALNPKSNFLHLSYSDLLVNDNSEHIRSIMRLPIYKELFPESALLRDKGSAERWKTKENGEFYGVPTQGQVTGFGAGRVEDEFAVIEDEWLTNTSDPFLKKLGQLSVKSNVFDGAVIIDDPIKPMDAQSDTIRSRVNQNFEMTIRNRVNSRHTPIIIIMQRVHENDLCGYLLELEPEEWKVLSIPTILEHPETGQEFALWPFKHTLEELYKLRRADGIIFGTQYQQDPTPREGLMYDEFETYSVLPRDPKAIVCSYTDTADTGADYLCTIVFLMTDEFNYVIDVEYTQEPMELTEPSTAKLLSMHKVAEALVESNNGGRGFARNVIRLMKTMFRNFRTKVKWFYQTSNKWIRIFSNSASVNNTTVFPVGWDKKWPEFHKAVTTYRKANNKKNVADDAVDALTGTFEMRDRISKRRKPRRLN